MTRHLFLLSAILVFSCHGPKEISQGEPNDEKEISTFPNVITEKGFDRQSDPCRIYSVSSEGTILSIAVEYGGGCKEHRFDLYTDGSIMKSLPPKQQFFLKHYSDQDMCKALLRDTVSFELNGIRPEGSELVVIIEGYEEELRVEF